VHHWGGKRCVHERLRGEIVVAQAVSVLSVFIDRCSDSIIRYIPKSPAGKVLRWVLVEEYEREVSAKVSLEL
jgi:hypothetical protein